jgi:hypothetical protein
MATRTIQKTRLFRVEFNFALLPVPTRKSRRDQDA